MCLDVLGAREQLPEGNTISFVMQRDSKHAFVVSRGMHMDRGAVPARTWDLGPRMCGRGQC